MSVSVVIPTFNEAQNIERCLASIYPIADEIILVDAHSTDETVTLAQKLDPSHKITLLKVENHPNFHKNKQKGIEAATKDWIFQIDADEAITPELADEILGTVDSSDARDGYWIPRLNYFLGRPLRKGGQYPDPTLRLYKRGKGALPAKDVHEQAHVTGTVGTLKHHLLHYPYPDFKTYIHKWVRYAALEADREFKSGTRPSFSNFILFCVLRPKLWFLSTYFRHKGFQDGMPGFTFSLFSALRFVVIYAMLWERAEGKKA